MDGTILITGGAGFLGSHLVSTLSSEDKKVSQHVAATYHSRKPPPNLPSSPSLSWHQVDLTDRSQAASLLYNTKPHVIIHALTPGVFAPPNPQYRVNYLSTKYLVELAKHHPSVHSFIYISSAEAVGLASGYSEKPETEDDAVLCTLEKRSNAYARTKGAADALVLAANTNTSWSDQNRSDTMNGFEGYLLTAVLRFPGIYGPRDTVLTERILCLAGTAATRFQIGPNKAVHEWLYVDSAVGATLLTVKTLVGELSIAQVVEEEYPIAIAGQAFFITDGKPVKYWDFSRMIWAAAGDAEPGWVLAIPFWLFFAVVGVANWVFWIVTLRRGEMEMRPRMFEWMRKGCWLDGGKARRVLRYEPVCSTEEGVRRSVEWFMENGGLEKEE